MGQTVAANLTWVVLVTVLLFLGFLLIAEPHWNVDTALKENSFASTKEMACVVSHSTRYAAVPKSSNVRYESISNCTVRVLTSAQASRIHRMDNVTLQPCTWQAFDANLQTTGEFYGRGHWIADREKSRLAFYPETCQFMNSLDDANLKYLADCIPQKNITKILITGDSNSGALHERFQDLFRELSKKCRIVKRSHSLDKNTSYFAVPSVPQHRLMDFTSGESCLTRCDLRGDRVTTLDLELLPLSHFAEVGLLLSPKISGTYKLRSLTANNMVEYLLKYYFPHHGFPDLWIVSPAFKHEAWDGTVDSLQVDTQHFLDLLDLYLPPTTQVIFMGNARECGPKQPPHVKEFLQERLQNMDITKNELMHDMNQMYYRLLRKELETHKNYHVFLDAMKISCPLTCEWHRDGAHFIRAWYEKMTHYLLESLCQSI